MFLLKPLISLLIFCIFSVHSQAKYVHPLSMRSFLPEVGEQMAVIDGLLGFEQNVSDTEGLYFTGLIFLWTNEYEKALSYFEKAVKKNPHYADVYLQIGFCNVKLGRYTEAIEAFKQAIHINPYFAEAYNGLGTAYFIRGHYAEASEAYKQAIRIQPDYADAHAGLLIAYLRLGDEDSAFEEYKILKELNSDLANDLLNFIYEKENEEEKMRKDQVSSTNSG